MKQARKILLVGSDDFYIEVIGTFVKLFLQYELVSVRAPSEAFKRMRAERPDIVILDLDRGTEDTLSFAEEMRDDPESKRIPVLAIAHPKASRDALGRGCSAFLTKPFKVRDLEAQITKLLR